MATIPTPIIAAVAPIAFSVANQDIALDGTGSQLSAGGAAFVTWAWEIFYRPDGATVPNCYLTNANTSTPTLRYPGGVSGSVGIKLTLVDDNPDPALSSSYPNYYPQQNGAVGAYGKGIYEFVGPVKTQILFVTMLTQNGLMLPAVGHRQWFTPTGGYHDLVQMVDGLATTITSYAAMKALRTRYVFAGAGDVEADGSPGNPFNATSAAAKTNPYTALPFIGPVQQAQVSLLDVAVTDQPELGYTIVMCGGAYTENITISAQCPWTFACDGAVTVTGNLSYTAANAPLAFPNLSISPLIGIGSFTLVGSLQLGNPVANPWLLYLENVTLTSVAVTGTCLTGVSLSAFNTQVSSTFNVPNLVLALASDCLFAGATVAKIDKAERCRFGGVSAVTVSAASAVASAGLYDCSWVGATQFSGPAGSALFDPITRARFSASSCTYAGGAGTSDVLRVGRLISDEATFEIVTINGDIEINALGVSKYINLWAEDGFISLQADGANKPINITATGEVDLAAPKHDLHADHASGTLVGVTFADSGGFVTATLANHGLSNYDNIYITGTTNWNGSWRVSLVDANNFQLRTLDSASTMAWVPGADNTGNVYHGEVLIRSNSSTIITSVGEARLHATGVADVSLKTADGNILLEANGAGPENGIGLLAAGAISLSAGGYALIETTGADKDLTLQTFNGNIQVQASGAGKYALLEATDGRVEVKANGTAHHVSVSTTDGNVSLSAVGSGRSIAMVSERILLNTVDAATFIRTLKAYAPNQATTGTTKELLASYTVADDFFIVAGARLHIEVLMSSAANANSKTFDLELDGTTLSTLTANGPLAVLRISADIFCLGSASQFTRSNRQLGTAGSVITEDAVTTKDFAAGTKQIQVYGTSPVASGEVTAALLSVDYHPAVA